MSFQCTTLLKCLVCAVNTGIIARQCIIILVRKRELYSELFSGLTGTVDFYWNSVHCLPDVNLPRIMVIDKSFQQYAPR